MGAVAPKVIRRIAIYREEKALTIAPRQRDAAVGDEIIFQNTTREPLTVSIPDAGLFGQADTFTIAPSGSAGPFIVQPDAAGGYPYAVYSLDTREFAHASVPIIIIYPH